MRRHAASPAVCWLLIVLIASVGAGSLYPTPARAAAGSASRVLTAALRSGMQAAGPSSGAYVEDLSTGRILFSRAARAPRAPASVQKLYTTSTALLEFGPQGRLPTSVLGVGSVNAGVFNGTLYLRGGGDPSFGSAAFDRRSYGTGATVQQLVRQLVARAGIHAVRGTIVADESWFDSRRGTPATGYAPSIYVEGALSALAFNRGWADSTGSLYVSRPALVAGQQFAAALRGAGVKVPAGLPIRTGPTPGYAQPLAAVSSPSMVRLVALTNTPSDNFFAETLLKDLGAQFGSRGATAAGAAVVRRVVAAHFALHPHFNDGSGLSASDRTTPLDVVSLLRQQAANPPFVASLAVAGRTGTLRHEMQGTYAAGRCRGKTGTLTSVSNVAGYCRARDGHTLAYALMMGNIYPGYAHPIQNRMEVAIARYNG